jgi:hypothetical protein
MRTDERFWDCECKDHYIHNKKDRRVCPYCYRMTEDMPDSKATELKSKANHFNERRAAWRTK